MNKPTFRTAILLLSILIAAGLFPASAGAYSYGSANTEAVAETFKLAAGKLNAEPPDWTAAKAAYGEIRSELESHFGKDVTKEMDDAFAAQDKNRVLADWKGVLVLNLDRRFTYAEQVFTDYNQAKTLLAKARATYETLKPYMTEQVSDQKLAELDQAFEDALNALGNPGLFGVGKKEPNPDLFKQKIKLIYDTVSPLFQEAGGGNMATGEPGASPAPHPPMTQTNKTNTAVTIGAVVIVAAVAALLYWRSRRRKS
ncbi:hypothetical protein E5161_11885 [Cohnella pontilimi]|uniref:LPXTG cell wall anchor domain-containing protein n=1 Tax=Cohnella pontilimi TaxID=2564100 RepID=A0A4U0FAS4_9BACL|nr:hypothetical protein [Cohnella pontilimi]TJY41896.1 hypothetical protein E5161_11885 [Cohnella pontilimi]